MFILPMKAKPMSCWKKIGQCKKTYVVRFSTQSRFWQAQNRGNR